MRTFLKRTCGTRQAATTLAIALPVSSTTILRRAIRTIPLTSISPRKSMNTLALSHETASSVPCTGVNMAFASNDRQAFAPFIQLAAYASLAFAVPGSAAALRYYQAGHGGRNNDCAKIIVMGIIGFITVVILIRVLWACWKKRRYRFTSEKDVQVRDPDDTQHQEGVKETPGAASEVRQM
ncbi:hypothetical protein F5Y03DRAFT_190228 [Xylaria venustula]|nr:hypothetical protein F5Y03DRAFT_190228 [Xylaria venustula]